MFIVIGEKCWLVIDVFVVFGVMIGDGIVVGVWSSVFKMFLVNVVCWGNFVVVICECVEIE